MYAAQQVIQPERHSALPLSSILIAARLIRALGCLAQVVVLGAAQ
jgi:hypothetical protein